MKVGKVPADQLRRTVLTQLGRRRPEVLLHAGIGEDAAALDSDGKLVVIASDPITGTSAEIGRLAVHVATNDVAASGAEPLGVQVTLLLPDGTDDEWLADIMRQIDRACRDVGVEVLGGHTEITSKVSDSIVVVTAVGLAERGRLIASGGARPGDDVWVTKGVGLEGSAILAHEAADRLSGAVSPATLERARCFTDEISVLPEARLAASCGVSAMHDVTEGGLYGALWELSEAAGVGFSIASDRVPIREETRRICDAVGLDPCGLISSGTLLITIPAAAGAELGRMLAENGITATHVGEVKEKGVMEMVAADGSVCPIPKLDEDELWRYMGDESTE